jgi:hypothetical protein
MNDHATDLQQNASNSNSITTSVALEFSKDVVLAQLRNFETLIKLNPLVQSFKETITDVEPSSYSYQIVDQLKVFGVTFLQSYTARFTPTDDGASVSIKASLGVSTTSRWVVEELGSTRVKVSETSRVYCNCILRGYVVSQIKSSHLILIRELCKKLDDDRNPLKVDTQAKLSP